MAMTFATDINTNGYTVKADKISAPLSSGSTDFGLGTGGYVIKSSGSSIYWAEEQVLQSLTNSEQWRKVLLNPTDASTSVTEQNTTTQSRVYWSNYVAVQPSTGKLRVGSLNIGSKWRLEYNETDESLDFTVTG